jgi:tetratricopeptide (TPR) repeat protein
MGEMEFEQEAVFEAFEEMVRESVQLVVNLEPDAEKFINLVTLLAADDFFAFFGYLNTGSKDELRRVARLFAMQIWNATPLPSNHYRPKPLPMPRRNDPCFCSSGRKYKQCCARLDDGGMPPVPPELVTGFLLEVITQAELKQAYLYFPHDLLAYVAGEWVRQDEYMAKRALMMLDPIFRQEDAKLTHRDEMALDAMFEICTALDKPRKKSALIRRMIRHPVKVLKTAALHRQCTMFSDQGKDAEAWACFQQAQRIDPNDPALSHLELLLLMQQGKYEQMQQRGKFWLKRLRSMNRKGELDHLIELIEQMLSDGPTAFSPLLEQLTPGAGRLIGWLQRVMKQPPAVMEKIQSFDDFCGIEPKNSANARLLQQWNALIWQHEEMWDDPEPWLQMLEAHPELAGSIVVIDDLIQSVYQLGAPNPAITFQPLIMLAMLQTKALIPMQPKLPLIWSYMNNRPTLRAIDFLADTMEDLDDDQTTLELREWLLRLNPNDNQGMRSAVMNAYLRLGRNEDAVVLCEHYPEDFDVSICFGHALALFRLDREHAANKRLIEAIEQSPRIPDALLRQRMKEPDNLHSGYITLGGEDEAWNYRESARDIWLATPGATEWLKRVAKVVK